MKALCAANRRLVSSNRPHPGPLPQEREKPAECGEPSQSGETVVQPEATEANQGRSTSSTQMGPNPA